MTDEINDISQAVSGIETEKNEHANEVCLTIDQRDVNIPLASLELTMESSQEEVFSALESIVTEEGGSLYDEYGNPAYAMRRANNTRILHVYPKTIAG